MLHRLQPEQLGPHGEAMARAVSACVHCGFCLPACPTYRELGQEMDSPRGRIILMKEVMEGTLALDEALPHIDRCLGCLGCEPACPSGVGYRDLISPFRARAERQRKPRRFFEKLRRQLLARTLPNPDRFARGARLAGLIRPLAPLLPGSIRPLFDLLPDRLPPREKLRSRYRPAADPPRARVALLAGCAQQVLAPEINRAAIEVLTANGVEVRVPDGQGCCGALSWHVGDSEAAKRLARRNLDAFAEESDSLDAIIATAAGCGSGLREYGLILAGIDREDDARDFAGRVLDVTEFLSRIGLEPPPHPLPRPIKVAYHDACHLSNGQGVTAAPRALLRSIPNLELIEIADGALCCGSAGTYNLDQPEIAADLGRQKAERIMETRADRVATGNIGCLTQLRHHLAGCAGDSGPPVVQHTIEILAAAYR